MRQLFFFFILFFSITVTAQKATILYKSRVLIDSTKIASMSSELLDILLEKSNGENYVLLIDNDKSLYKPEKEEAITTFNEDIENANTIRRTIKHKYIERIFIDTSSKKMISQYAFNGELYNITEDLKGTSWTMHQDEKVVHNIVCKKATTVYQSREIIAWYAPELDIKLGPSSFYGLPGLILELKLGKRIITAVDIKYENKLPIVSPDNGEDISREDYNSILNRSKKRKVGTQTIFDGTEMKTITIKKG